MINTLIARIASKAYKKDIFYAILFGVLSIFFAKINFYIPGFEGLDSNFREIPLLISIFYIRNPLYIVVLCLITILYTSIGIPYALNFSLHLVSLLGIWVLYFYTKSFVKSIVPKTIMWVIIAIIYYMVLLIPAYLFFGKIVGHFADIDFYTSYKSVFNSLYIEIITTILVSSLYLLQFEIRVIVVKHKNELEDIVKNRTEELALANKTLTYLNENLDDLVKHRSMKIQKQLDIIVKYAHMNSHEVRAPLARILGLLELIKLENTVKSDSKVITDLGEAGKELDTIISSMNRLLEKEIDSNVYN